MLLSPHRLSFLLISLLLLTSLSHCLADGLLQEVPQGGNIDWRGMSIRCEGIGEVGAQVSRDRQATAIDLARLNTMERILTTLRAVAVNSQRTVGQMMDLDSDLEERIRALAGNFQEKEVHHMSDGSVEIDVELSLCGQLMEVLLPATGGGKRVPDGLLCPLCGQPWSPNKDIPPDLKLVSSQGIPAHPFTGLVIDARGLGVRPALAPLVLNENGKSIYGPSFAQRCEALTAGLVSYESDVEVALRNDRVTPGPLVVRALRTAGSGKIDIVIANEQGALLHALPEHMQFLEECRIVVVID